MTKPIPEPAPDCPRCHHFELVERGEIQVPHSDANQYPPIDQGKALEVLTLAFPRAYGVKR